MPPHPDVARARATVAGLTRCVRNGERPQEVLLVAKERLEQAKVSAKIDELVAAAPTLTSEQRTKLAALLKPVRGGA